MGASFDEDFLDFVSQRRQTAYNKLLKSDNEQGKRYAQYNEKYSKIEKEITERLGANDEAFDLLFNLSDAKGLINSMEMDAFYIQGLQDGINLVRVLNEGITWPASRDHENEGEA